MKVIENNTSIRFDHFGCPRVDRPPRALAAPLPTPVLDALALVRWHDGADKQVDELADRHAGGVGRPS